MKSKLLIIVMAVVLFVNSYDLRVFANTGYDHDELLEYEGYAESVYETLVEQTTFINGAYTQNKEFVSNTIDEVKGYAKQWWNEYNEFSNLPPAEKFRAMFENQVSTALTIGDWVKNLFNGFGEQKQYPTYDSHLDSLFTFTDTGTLYAANGYTMKFNVPELSFETRSRNIYWSGSGTKYSGPYLPVEMGSLATVDAMKTRYASLKQTKRYGDLIRYLSYFNTTVNFIRDSDKTEVVSAPTDWARFRDGLPTSSTPKQLVMPQPKAYLSCPDGTKIGMTINGSTFLDVNGKVMQVSKDGTATVSTQICNLGWEKPTVQYIDGTDQVGITTPDNDIIDAETGEIITEGEFDDEIPDDCSLLCAIGKFMGGLGSIAKAIAAIPLKILDGLFELVKKIVVPPDGFWTEQIDEIEKQFFKDEIKENIDSLKDLGGAAGGQFQDVSVSLMGVDNVTVVDSDSINMSLDTIHGWVRGIFYPLLLFFNISMLYRLIRGTSFVGIGETKGGGDK